MDISKVTAIVLAVLAAVLVMIAGKSCTDDIASTNQRARRNNKNTTAATEAQQFYTRAPETDPETEPTTEPPTLPYDVVTNMIGDVIETIPRTTEDNGEQAVTETTVTKSILEQYEELHETTVPPTQEETETATTYIEPATNIVIHLG